MLQALEAKITEVWHELSGEARADLEKALADAKEALAGAKPVLAEFEAGVKAAVTAAEPEVKAGVEALVAKLLADFGPLLGDVAKGL